MTRFSTPLRKRGRPYLGPTLTVLVVLAAVGATVGPIPAVIAAPLLLGHRLMPGRHVLGTAAVLAMVALPVAWFAGSSLPLVPPAPRVQDNVWVHQTAGLAVWLLFLAAWVDRRPALPHVGRASVATGEEKDSRRTNDVISNNKDAE